MKKQIGISKALHCADGFCDTCGQTQKNELLKDVYCIAELFICVGCMIEMGELSSELINEHLNKITIKERT